jgi:hypothetical protein
MLELKMEFLEEKGLTCYSLGNSETKLKSSKKE